jgi:Lon protease-like protein
MATLPLFPLRAVLFPEGTLSLRIFEPRYLSMVGQCMKDGGGFGVVLARGERSTSSAVDFHPFGTSCEITDWGQGEDGMLNIVVHGRRRFAVTATHHQPDGLIVGEVEYRESGWGRPLSDDDAWLADLTAQMMTELSQSDTPSPLRMDDANWVSFRLCELMPLVLTQRQALLQMDDTDARLAVLRQAIRLIEDEEEGEDEDEA